MTKSLDLSQVRINYLIDVILDCLLHAVQDLSLPDGQRARLDLVDPLLQRLRQFWKTKGQDWKYKILIPNIVFFC